jgi:hypothetical protein
MTSPLLPKEVPFDGLERRQPLVLDEEILERIAEAAAKKAIEKLEGKLYQEIGKQFVSRLVGVIGLLIAGFWAWVQSHSGSH